MSGVAGEAQGAGSGRLAAVSEPDPVLAPATWDIKVPNISF